MLNRDRDRVTMTCRLIWPDSLPPLVIKLGEVAIKKGPRTRKNASVCCIPTETTDELTGKLRRAIQLRAPATFFSRHYFSFFDIVLAQIGWHLVE